MGRVRRKTLHRAASIEPVRQPEDRSEIRDLPANSESLKKTSENSAAEAALGCLFSPSTCSLSELESAVESLGKEGVKFERRTRFLGFLWNNGWKEAEPEQTAKHLLKNKHHRLRFQAQGETLPIEFLTTAGEGDVGERVRAGRLAGEMGLGRSEQLDLISKGLADHERLEKLEEFGDYFTHWSPEGRWGRESINQRGSVWSDSPGGRYGDDVDQSLTRSLSLKGLQKPRLCFQERHAFEASHDRCRLEVRVLDGEWQVLKKFENTADWKEAEVDLSAFAHQEVELRFRTTSDSSSTHDGMQFARLRLKAEDFGGRPVERNLHEQPRESQAQKLLELGASANPADITEALGATRRVGDLDAGLYLWESLQPGAVSEAAQLAQDLRQQVPDSREAGILSVALHRSGIAAPDFSQKREALVHLTHDFGAARAVEVMPQLEKGSGTLASRVDLYRVAHELDSEAPEELYQKLSGLPAGGELGALRSLARHLQDWETGGSWCREKIPGVGEVWSDGPGRYRDDQDTTLTRPLPLQGLEESRLRFKARFDLEQGPDYCEVQLSTDGENWKPLRRLTGRSDWSDFDLDLSEYDGRNAQLRFAFHTDTSSVREGIQIAGLRLEAKDTAVALQPQYESADRGRMLDFLRRGGDATRLAALTEGLGDVRSALEVYDHQPGPELFRMSDELGTPREAARLWPALGPYLKHPEFEQAAAYLTDLCQERGPERALRDWASLQLDPKVSLAAQFDLMRISQSILETDQVEHYQEMSQKLLRAGFERPEARARLHELSRHLKVWKNKGWGSERVAGRGAVWSDSPGQKYQDDQEKTLTRQLNLAGVQNARLVFDAEVDLESGPDRLEIQVSRDGEEWIELKSLTGQQDWQSSGVDLSAYDNEKIQLRFRFHSDSSAVRDGVLIDRIQLLGQGVSVPIHHQFTPDQVNEIVNGLLDQPTSEQRLAELERLMDLTRKLGDVWAASQARNQIDNEVEESALVALAGNLGNAREALEVWPLLRPAPDSQRTQLLADLVRERGAEGGTLSWNSWKLPHDAQPDRVALVRTTRALVGDGDPGREGRIFKQLDGAGLSDATSRGHLGFLSRHLQPFTIEGDWAQEEVPEVGVVWSDSPGGTYQDSSHSSMTRSLSLDGLRNCRLRFKAAYDLESSDPVTFQVSQNGQEWFDLRRYSGEREWHGEELNLSRFDGQKLQLRIRMDTDSSVRRKGFMFQDLTLVGESDLGVEAVPVGADFRAGDLEGLVEAVTDPTRTPAERRQELASLTDRARQLKDATAALALRGHLQGEAELKRVVQMSQKLGDPRGAAELWKEMERYRGDSPRLDAYQKILTHVTFHDGLEAGVKAARGVDLGDELPPQRAESLFLASRMLAKATGGDQVREFGRLKAAGFFSPAQVETVRAMARCSGVWDAGGDWTRVISDGAVHWKSQPGEKYRDDRLAHLSRPMTLAGLKDSRLSFEIDYHLESSDPCSLQVSRDGKVWTTLERFTGEFTGGKSYDLSRFDGQELQLRFEFQSDGSVNYRGVDLSKLKLAGQDQESGREVEVLLDEPLSSAETLSLVETLASPELVPSQRQAVFTRFVTLAEQAGFEAAVALLPAAENLRGDNKHEGLQALLLLSQALTPREARSFWERHKSLDGRALYDEALRHLTDEFLGQGQPLQLDRPAYESLLKLAGGLPSQTRRDNRELLLRLAVEGGSSERVAQLFDRWQSLSAENRTGLGEFLRDKQGLGFEVMSLLLEEVAKPEHTLLHDDLKTMLTTAYENAALGVDIDFAENEVVLGDFALPREE